LNKPQLEVALGRVTYRLDVATELGGRWEEAENVVLRVIDSDAASETVEAVFLVGVAAQEELYVRIVAVPTP